MKSPLRLMGAAPVCSTGTLCATETLRSHSLGGHEQQVVRENHCLKTRTSSPSLRVLVRDRSTSSPLLSGALPPLRPENSSVTTWGILNNKQQQ